MRKIIIVCLTALLLAASVGAPARGYGYRGYGNGYGYGYRPGYGYYGRGAGYFVGGLLLGTMLAPPRVVYAPPPRVIYTPPGYVPSPRVVYVPQPGTTTSGVYTQPAQTTVTRRLLRDINGNCFERKINSGGTELRIQLPATECDW